MQTWPVPNVYHHASVGSRVQYQDAGGDEAPQLCHTHQLPGAGRRIQKVGHLVVSEGKAIYQTLAYVTGLVQILSYCHSFKHIDHKDSDHWPVSV